MKNKLLVAGIVTAGIIAVLVLRPSDGPQSIDMGSSAGRTSSEPAANPDTVTMKNIEFTVKKLTVKKGTTVTWRNDDTAQHSIVFDSGDMSEANSPGLLDKGDEHQYKFTKTGTFKYHCTPHPFMKAEIVVVN